MRRCAITSRAWTCVRSHATGTRALKHEHELAVHSRASIFNKYDELGSESMPAVGNPSPSAFLVHPLPGFLQSQPCRSRLQQLRLSFSQ
jgi:hypothetical protein